MALLPDFACVYIDYIINILKEYHSHVMCSVPPMPESVKCTMSNETSIGIAISPPMSSPSSYVISNYHVTYASLVQGFPGSANETVPFSADTVLSHYNSATAGVTYVISVRSFVSGTMSDDVSTNCTSGGLNIVFFVKQNLIVRHM